VSEKLKLCPFCGGEATMRESRHGWFLTCDRCRLVMKSIRRKSRRVFPNLGNKVELIARWNKRDGE